MLMRFDDLRFLAMTKIARLIYPGYRFKWPQLDWLQHAEFNAYLARFGERSGYNAERRWMIRELMRLIDEVPGDTAECGAYIGAGSYLICRMNTLSPAFKRHHFVFDSFEGVSDPGKADGAYWRRGDLAAGEETVRQTLAEFAEVTLLKGWIPSRFQDVADRKFAFLHIDVDLFEPTRDSLEFFYERMSAGGIVVCDDYGFSTCPGATTAVDAFLADKPEQMIALPGGGGFFIKGHKTSHAGGLDR